MNLPKSVHILFLKFTSALQHPSDQVNLRWKLLCSLPSRLPPDNKVSSGPTNDTPTEVWNQTACTTSLKSLSCKCCSAPWDSQLCKGRDTTACIGARWSKTFNAHHWIWLVWWRYTRQDLLWQHWLSSLMHKLNIMYQWIAWPARGWSTKVRGWTCKIGCIIVYSLAKEYVKYFKTSITFTSHCCTASAPARWVHKLSNRAWDTCCTPWFWTYHLLFSSFPMISRSLLPPFTHFRAIFQRVPGTSKLLDSREISCINLQFGNLCSPRRQQRFSVVCRMHTVTPPLLFFTVLNKSIYKTI